MLAISTNTVADYYNKNQILYNLLWSGKALHYGFWDNNTKTHSQSLENTDAFISSCLNLSSADRVLDAGCGVGGTAFYIAKKTGAKVVGISISEVQVKQALRALKRNKDVSHLLAFEKKDFTHTGYENNSFDKIYAITSSCQANSKYAFVSEMYRLLKPGGKLLVSDAFLSELKTEKDKKMLNSFFRGWAIPNLASRKEFDNILTNIGFKKIQCEEQTEKIKKSCNVSWKLGVVFYPFSWIGSLLGIIPKNMHPHCVACILQKHLFDNGVIKYYSFVAEK